MGSIPARVIQVFISAIGLYFSIGSEIAGRNADSVSKDTFLLVQFKKFPNPSSKSNDIAYFFAYFHPLVIRLICRKAYLAMHTQPSNI